SVDLLTSTGWPSIISCNSILDARNPSSTQQQSFNTFVDSFYKRLNEEHLEILEGFNDTETEQILVNKIEQALINMGV
ncbi:15279_t:CDS:2, partial [Cetraspora pellucida]